VDVELTEPVFVRIPGGDPAWLADLRWSPETLAAFDVADDLAAVEERLLERIEWHRASFPNHEWAELQSWLARAARRRTIGTPRLLERDRAAREDVLSLVEVRRRIADDRKVLEALTSHEAAAIEERVLGKARDPGLAPILGDVGWDLATSIDAAVKGSPLSAKDRRNLARAICSHLARSVHKSAPLGLTAGTGVLCLRPGQQQTCVRVGDAVCAAMRPNQELCNRLIGSFRPLGDYLSSGGRLHFNVAGRIDRDRLLWWRAERSGEVVRESLAALKTSSRVRAGVEAPNDLEADDAASLRSRLVQSEILSRDDLVSPTTVDPWAVVQSAAEFAAHDPRSAQLLGPFRHARELVRPFLTPRSASGDDVTGVQLAVQAMRVLGNELVSAERTPSAAVSLDSYRLVDGGIGDDHLRQVKEAVRQYLLVGGLAYSRTPTYGNRKRLVEHFRDVYGDDRPVRLEDVLVREWDVIDGLLSFLLSPTNPPVHPENDLVFPEPTGEDDAYASLYRKLEHAMTSEEPVVRLDPIEQVAPVLDRAQPVVDVICRLGHVATGHLDVVVEAVTMWGRLTARHLPALANLDRIAGRAFGTDASAHPPVREGHVQATVLASPSHPRLQNLSRIEWKGEPLLALSEPVSPEALAAILRYGDLFVRYDPEGEEFVVTEGPEGPALEFSWPSPLSPSFSRRLHFLRFLTLVGRPVVAAPRWMPREGRAGGHLPRVHVGPLVLSPERWSLPLEQLADLTAVSRPRAYALMRSIQRRLRAPDEVFAYSSADTRPVFIDLAAPWGAEALLLLLRRAQRQSAATVLLEERFPGSSSSVAGPNFPSCSFVFRCQSRSDPEE
jgi:hypothetical protein